MDDLQKELFRAIFAGFAGAGRRGRAPDGGAARVRRPRLRTRRRPRGDDRPLGRVHGHRRAPRRRRQPARRVRLLATPTVPARFTCRSLVRRLRIHPPFLRWPRSRSTAADHRRASPCRKGQHLVALSQALARAARRAGRTRTRSSPRAAARRRQSSPSAGQHDRGSRSTARACRARSTARARRSRRRSTKPRSPASHEGTPDITVNYARRRLGQGQDRPRRPRRVDFAGTDSLVKPEDLPKYQGGGILYFPTVAAPITVSYNLSGVDKLQLDARHARRRSSSGKITKWNDAGDRGRQPRRRPAGHRHRRRAPRRRLGHDEQLHQVPRRPRRPTTWTLGSGDTVELARRHAGRATATPASRRSSSETDGAIGYVDFADADGVRA